VVIHREATGNVKVDGRPEGLSPGNIPGLEIDVTGTANSARVTAVTRKAGTLRVWRNDVDIEGKGTL
jgi:hypothetical protein